MYEITLGCKNGETMTFKGINTIKYGASIQSLKPLTENEIAQSAFDLAKIFHFIGKNVNIVYHDPSTNYIEIRKLVDATNQTNI